jgi:hypothetical protein
VNNSDEVGSNCGDEVGLSSAFFPLIMWNKQNLLGKKIMIKSLYPKGILVDGKNMLYRTENKNQFIAYIQDIAGFDGQIKKRKSETKINFSALVEALRLLSNL